MTWEAAKPPPRESCDDSRRNRRGLGRRKRGFELGHLHALFLKLGLMRKGVAQPGPEAGQPVRDFGGCAALFGEFDV